MKKTFILLLLLVCVQSGFTQERLIDILDSLEVVNVKIEPHNIVLVKDSNYFEAMQKKNNFLFPDYNNLIIYLKSYKQYSIFMRIYNQSFSKEIY